MVGYRTIRPIVEDDILHIWSVDALQKCRRGCDHGTLPRVPLPKIITFCVVAHSWELAVINGAAHVVSEKLGSHLVLEKHYHPLFRQ